MENGNKEKFVRLADIVPESVVDGKGIRMTVFVQGCRHACAGCHNPTTWDENGGEVVPLSFITDMAEKNPLLDGLTFSGGEPFLQPAPLCALAKWCHARALNVWCYSGYTYEQLRQMGENDVDVAALLNEIDVLVDGPFVEKEKDLMLAFRGSRNQRVLDMRRSREQNKPVLLMV
ncbi:MAG: anaerobic ribonucleoside-triphosphate reductase activating protein [Clostridia bacterium]|nr:anaerobic ribonucleoside-triphosphate reductase activating protein [Clostridia bacterium]